MPHASVASHVRVITCEHELPVVVEVSRLTVAPLHASVAVGATKFGLAVHSIVALAPALPIVGPWVSTTVIICVCVPL